MKKTQDPTISNAPKANDTIDTELQNTTATGNPPLKRIGTASAARAIYDDLKENSIPWALARARIQGMYDGHAPHDSAQLQRLGRSWSCNVNFREMESLIDTNAAEAWSLHLDIGPVIDCKIDSFYLPTDGTGSEWSDIIAEEYTRTLLSWPGFFYNVDMVTKDSMKYGCGGMVWENEWDWRAKAFQIGNLLVPARAKCDLDKLDLYLLRDEMSIHDLYLLTEDRVTSEKAGWDIGQVKKTLVKAYKDHTMSGSDDDKEQTSTWESLQTAMRTYDPAASVMDYDGLRIVHLLVKEATPGKGVSHYIIAEDEVDEDEKFLFAKEGRYKTMANSMWLLPHNYGDGGKIRSIKGLGHRSLPHCEFSNRFLCQLFDSGVLASSLVVKLTKSTDADELQMLRIGPITVLPPALEPVQTSFMPKMEGLVQLRSMSKDILLNNTGVYRPRSEANTQQNAYPTAEQVRTESMTGARFERSQATFFYVQWEMYHQETYRRMTNPDYILSKMDLPGKDAAKSMLMRCVQRGVPPDLLMTPGIVRVYSARALGLGSLDARMSMTNQLVAMKPSMDEKGRNWTDRQWAAARVGYWNVDKVYPKGSRDSIPGNAMSIAVLENNAMLDGRACMVGSDQPHAIHSMAVMSMLARYAEAFSKFGLQGLTNLSEAANGFRYGLPHLQEHIQAISSDPTRKDQIEQWAKVLQSLAQVGQQIVKASDEQQAMQVEQMQEQAAQPAQDPEVMLKLKQMQMDFELEQMKQESLNGMRQEKTEVQNSIKQQGLQVATQLQAQRQAEELAIAKERAQADIALKAAKAQTQGA